MKVLIFILSIVVFFKTYNYGRYEVKENNNKSGGVIVTILSFVALVFPNVMNFV